VTVRIHRKTLDALILGTVQFGLPYGVANRQGQPDIGQAREILDLAYNSGLRVLDTAAAYGSSEAVLGACDMDRWSVITKVPSCEGIDDINVGAIVRESVLRSLDQLRTGSLHAVLAHDPRDMLGPRGQRILESLEPLREQGLLGRIGVSVYDPRDIEGIAEGCTQIVQAPLNVLDQRFITSGQAAALRLRGDELHVRSIFLQGLLLMAGKDRPKGLAQFAPILAFYDERVYDTGVDPAAFCLGFVMGQADVSYCVVGVDTLEQMEELVTAFISGQDANIEAQDLISNERSLIDPRYWQDET